MSLDLFVHCPDIMWDAVLSEILARHESLGTRRLRFQVRRNSGDGDGGLRRRAHEYVRETSRLADRLLVIFDRHGCGEPAGRSAAEIEAALDAELATALGATDRACAVVVDPEIEAWVIRGHAQFGVLGSAAAGVDARQWFAREVPRGSTAPYWPDGLDKPPDPKAAIEAFLAAHGVKFSAANYRKLARVTGLRTEGCRAASFHRFVATLRRWFPPE